VNLQVFIILMINYYKITIKAISIFIITLFAVITIPLVTAQPNPSPQTSPPGGVPVVFDGKTLFVIHKNYAGLSIEKRASRISKRLQEYADKYGISLEALEITNADEEGIPITIITAEDILLLNLSDKDAEAAGKTRKELAENYVKIIQEAVSQYRKERSPSYLIRGAVISAIATLFLLLIFFILNNIFQQIYARLKGWGNTYIRPVTIGNVELIKANQLDNFVEFITQISQWVIILGILISYLVLVLSLFPWTQDWAYKFWQSFIKVIDTVALEFIAFLPNLLKIILLIIGTYFLLRLCRPFFHELSEGTLFIPGFYPEWAIPTYRLFSFFLIALTAVIIFPLLPVFDSPAFQGISVFLGVLFSLGSTSIVANVVSGTILIYTRAFRIGDRIKIGDTIGKVIETTMLVTRILTPTNVVISIPNSQIISSSIENFNFAAQELDTPLIVRTQVYLGYEVDWRQAYQALIQAALLTDGIAKSPTPFVLQSELNEVYVTYLLNVYIEFQYFEGKSETDVEKTRSQLHENIRDCCQQAGIIIFAPSYEADPDVYGPVATLPPDSEPELK